MNKQQEKSKIVIVPQTKILFVAFVLITLTMAILMARTSAVGPMNVFMFVYFLLSAALTLYIVNCTVIGKCNLLAWIMAYVYLVIGFFIAFMAMSILFKKA